MAKEEGVQVEGTVVEPLPNAMFAGELENGHRVRRTFSGQDADELHQDPARDKVTVEAVALPIVNRGAIIYRYSREPS